VKDVLTALAGGPWGGYLCVNKTVEKFRPRYYLLQARTDIEKWRWQCDLCRQLRPPNQESGPNESVQRRDSVMKDSHWSSRALLTERPTPFRNKRLRQLRKHWLPTSSGSSEYRESCVVIRDVTSSPNF
jgi:hypothetical protein